MIVPLDEQILLYNSPSVDDMEENLLEETEKDKSNCVTDHHNELDISHLDRSLSKKSCKNDLITLKLPSEWFPIYK